VAAHGSPRSTQDLDVVYHRHRENLRRIVGALSPHGPYHRGAPPGLPFRLDVETLQAGLTFALTTDLGWTDLLGEIAGAGSFEDIAPHSVSVAVFGIECRVIDLETPILAKKAAGRPKDFEVLAKLELLRQRSKPG